MTRTQAPPDILLGVIGVIFNRTILVCLDLARQVGLKTSPCLLPLLIGLLAILVLARFIMTAASYSIGLGGSPIYEELLKRTPRLAEPPQPPQGSAL